MSDKKKSIITSSEEFELILAEKLSAWVDEGRRPEQRRYFVQPPKPLPEENNPRSFQQEMNLVRETGALNHLENAARLISKAHHKQEIRTALMDQLLKGRFDKRDETDQDFETAKKAAQTVTIVNRICSKLGDDGFWQEYETRLANQQIEEQRIRKEREEKRRARQALELKERRKQLDDAKRLQATIREFFELASPAVGETYQLPAPVNENDLAVMYAWANSTPRQDACTDELFDDLEKLIGHESLRLASARLAEKAAISYFRSLGKVVEDVSSTQLDPHRNDWKTHDLLVNLDPIDVKNSRRSKTSPNSYSEHCIPRFKIARRSNSEVRILGVLSDYVTSNQMKRGKLGGCTVLGELCRDDMKQLEAWLSANFGDVLEVSLLRDSGFIPGWMFDYRTVKGLTNEDDSFDSTPIVKQALHFDLISKIPWWLLAFSNRRDLFETRLSDPADRRIWEVLQSQRICLGFSRRSLFAGILALTLLMAVQKTEDYHPSRWRKWVFVRNQNLRAPEHRPLGLFDSEQFIRRLIDALCTMWDQSKDQLERFKCFKLSGPNILKGLDEAQKWRTVLAYCGGWEPESGGKCGKNPLILGESENCALCLRLVCGECGFCSATCEANDARLK